VLSEEVAAEMAVNLRQIAEMINIEDDPLRRLIVDVDMLGRSGTELSEFHHGAYWVTFFLFHLLLESSRDPVTIDSLPDNICLLICDISRSILSVMEAQDNEFD
jgi:hypothetical protein